MRSDEELMQSVSNGEFEAFEELVRRHQSTAVGLAYNLLNDPSYAEDVAQEAFLKILRNADTYEPTAAFRTYLGRVVTHLCYDRTEKNKPLNIDPLMRDSKSNSEASPLGDVLDDERSEILKAAVDELPDRQRTAILLQTFEGFTYERIANVMDTTKKSVERLLARARDKLRKSLRDRIEVN